MALCCGGVTPAAMALIYLGLRTRDGSRQYVLVAASATSQKPGQPVHQIATLATVETLHRVVDYGAAQSGWRAIVERLGCVSPLLSGYVVH